MKLEFLLDKVKKKNLLFACIKTSDSYWLFNLREKDHDEIQWLEVETKCIQTKNTEHILKSEGSLFLDLSRDSMDSSWLIAFKTWLNSSLKVML